MKVLDKNEVIEWMTKILTTLIAGRSEAATVEIKDKRDKWRSSEELTKEGTLILLYFKGCCPTCAADGRYSQLVALPGSGTGRREHCKQCDNDWTRDRMADEFFRKHTDPVIQLYLTSTKVPMEFELIELLKPHL